MKKFFQKILEWWFPYVIKVEGHTDTTERDKLIDCKEFRRKQFCCTNKKIRENLYQMDCGGRRLDVTDYSGSLKGYILK